MSTSLCSAYGLPPLPARAVPDGRECSGSLNGK
jgi:hypothetical protein